VDTHRIRYHTLAHRRCDSGRRTTKGSTEIIPHRGVEVSTQEMWPGVVNRLSFSATFFLCVCPLYSSDRQTLIILLDIFGSVSKSLRHIQYLTIMTLYSLSVILVSCLYAMYISVVVTLTSNLTEFLIREYCETSCIASYVSCSDTNNNPDVLLVYNKGSSGCTNSFCLALQGLHELFR